MPAAQPICLTVLGNPVSNVGLTATVLPPSTADAARLESFGELACIGNPNPFDVSCPSSLVEVKYSVLFTDRQSSLLAELHRTIDTSRFSTGNTLLSARVYSLREIVLK